MLSRSTSRVAALLGAGALIISFGTPLAGAQEQGSLDTESVTNGLGGSAASVGSGDLGSNLAGGTCVALDPTLPFLTNTLNLEVTDVSDEPGVAGFNAELLGGISSSAGSARRRTCASSGPTSTPGTPARSSTTVSGSTICSRISTATRRPRPAPARSSGTSPDTTTAPSSRADRRWPRSATSPRSCQAARRRTRLVAAPPRSVSRTRPGERPSAPRPARWRLGPAVERGPK